MTKINKEKVKKYFAWRTDEDLRHCPDSIACACNDAAKILGYDKPLDLMKLVFFNEPIPSLHTHSYSFHTATGRHIIDTIIDYYHEYKNMKL